MIITPQNAIEFVLEKKAKDKPFKIYKTELEKILFWCCILTFLAGVVFGGSTYFFKNKYFFIIGILSLFASIILMLLFQVVSAIPELLKFKNPEKDISTNLLNNFNEDLDLINELSTTFEIHHLRYAYNCYQYMARQLRERISLLVGALSKVGIIPLAVTCYFSYSKIRSNNQIIFDKVEWFLVSLILLYLLAIRMTFTAQWMEQVAEIFNESIKIKENKKC